MSKTLVFLALISACLNLAGCASSLPEAEDVQIVNSSSVESDNQAAGGGNPTKIAAASKSITWDKSDTGTSGQQAKPDLSGSWVLNMELSDNPQEKIKESRQQAGNSRDGKSMDDGRGGGRGGKGSGGRRGGGGGRIKNSGQSGKGSGGRQESLPQELQTLLNASETLKLKHEEPLLTIITKDGQRQQVYTDFRGASVSASSAMDQKVITAGWESNVLVVETTMNSGSFIQRYNLIAASRQLLVNTVILIPSLPKSVQFSRVYELAETKTKESRIGQDTM